MSNSIRVMHVITRLVRGGAQWVVLELAHGLRAFGVETTLVAGTETGSEGSLWPEAETLEIPAIPLSHLVREPSPVKDFQAYWEIRRLIRAQRPDIVHAHTSKAGFLGCLAARHEKVRGVLLAPHGHILGEGAEIPGVPRRGMKRWLLGRAARMSVRYADRVIAPNETERNDGVRLGLWNEASSITIPNGIDTARFIPRAQEEARRRFGLAPEYSYAGVIARLTREKGVDLALRAAAEIPALRLLVAGDGPERGALGRLSAELGMRERVFFLGVVREVELLLPALDVCVIPSRTEAHGLVAAEALACGVPVVACAVGGLKSLILDEETGLRAPPEDPAALAAAIRRLLADPRAAAELARRGRAFVAERFSLQAMLREVHQLYRDTIFTRELIEA